MENAQLTKLNSKTNDEKRVHASGHFSGEFGERTKQKNGLKMFRRDGIHGWIDFANNQINSNN